MFVKIVWNKDKTTSVIECDEIVFNDPMPHDGSPVVGKDGPFEHAVLRRDGNEHVFWLYGGNMCYLMNGDGRTIDTHYTPCRQPDNQESQHD